jgi:FMN phosphatase YigB (HAD superfamily)
VTTSPTVPRFAGVLLDWNGTVAVPPAYPDLVADALRALDRSAEDAEVGAVLAALRGAPVERVDGPEVDLDVAAHRTSYLDWYRAAGLDDALAEALHHRIADPAAHRLAPDTGALLAALHDAGVRVGVLSDIHADLRPMFAAHRQPEPDGRGWDTLVHTWALSFETRRVKPDPSAFTGAVAALGLAPAEVLMVGDRAGWDGAAVGCGMTTLLLPSLVDPAERRLQRVLDLVLPGAVLGDAVPVPEAAGTVAGTVPEVAVPDLAVQVLA